MTDATIDLGELDSRSSPSVTHGWPLWERLRRHQRGMFRLIGGALAAALVFSLAAATPAVSPLKLMFQVHGVDQMTLDRQHLYALTRERLGERATLTAYRLTDGAVHWQATAANSSGPPPATWSCSLTPPSCWSASSTPTTFLSYTR